MILMDPCRSESWDRDKAHASAVHDVCSFRIVSAHCDEGVEGKCLQIQQYRRISLLRHEGRASSEVGTSELSSGAMFGNLHAHGEFGTRLPL